MYLVKASLMGEEEEEEESVVIVLALFAATGVAAAEFGRGRRWWGLDAMKRSLWITAE